MDLRTYDPAAGTFLDDAEIEYTESDTYYYITNIQGDVISLLNSDGDSAGYYQYDAWGDDVDKWAVREIIYYNPLRYRGYFLDPISNLYYLQTRFYDAKLGRFINADNTNILLATPMGLTDKNLFAYCDNNPVMRADHGGDFWHIVVGGVIGSVASFAATLLTGGSLSEAGVSALVGAASGALTAALPSAGFLIDVGAGVVEEMATNAMKGNSVSKESVIDNAVSVGVDSLSNLSSNGSRLTKETMQEFTEAIPKTLKGNHPKVKAPAQKIVRRTTKVIAKESGETIAGKTIGSVFKNILKFIF